MTPTLNSWKLVRHQKNQSILIGKNTSRIQPKLYQSRSTNIGTNQWISTQVSHFSLKNQWLALQRVLMMKYAAALQKKRSKATRLTATRNKRPNPEITNQTTTNVSVSRLLSQRMARCRRKLFQPSMADHWNADNGKHFKTSSSADPLVGTKRSWTHSAKTIPQRTCCE